MTNIQAIDLLKGLEQSLDDYCELNDEEKTAFHMALTALEVFGNSEQLPSAQPERKRGEWSDGYRWQRCSLCKQTGKKSWNYCPNCGAKMKGVNHETN